jgi:glycerol-3-phosphate dehydrogenase
LNRSTNLQRLQTETFDLCIIGAGASGAGCALDAALRGLKVALIDKEDFAAGTSSKSTKLIHGGVRYLEQAFLKLDFAQFKQVKHGLEERHLVLANAPHLARPLALITPVSNWIEAVYYAIGLKVYGWFAAGKDTLPKSRWLPKSEALRRIPGLTPNIHSAVLYYDGQLDDARYCLALSQSAAEAGATIVNHLEISGFKHDSAGKLESAETRDLLGGANVRIRARQFLNCAGPYADPIRQMADPAKTPRLRPSKGVHLVLPYAIMNGEDAMLIPKTKDGRVVFAIPFEGQLMLGTTDTGYSDLDKEPLLESEEVDFLIETLQRFAAQKIDKSQVKAGFGGLRPLIAAPTETGRSTKQLVRDHEVEYDPKSGLLSLLGGKWTTYRLMAEDAVNAVCEQLDITAPCKTKNHALAGGEGYDHDNWKKIRARFGFPEDIARHLSLKYGSRAERVAALAQARPELAARLHPEFPYIEAEVVYAAEHEMACTLRDFMARRIRFEITDWKAALQAAPRVAERMGEVLGWSEAEQQAQAQAYRVLLNGFMDLAR